MVGVHVVEGVVVSEVGVMLHEWEAENDEESVGDAVCEVPVLLSVGEGLKVELRVIVREKEKVELRVGGTVDDGEIV